MRPFFPYFGAKFKLARILGRPRLSALSNPLPVAPDLAAIGSLRA
jgi:hypothetical protein